MKTAEKIKRLFCKSNVTVGSKVDDKILGDTLSAFEKSMNIQSIDSRPSIWGILKTRRMKLGTLAIMLVVCTLGFLLYDELVTPVWAIDQTAKALKGIRTLVICGMDRWGDTEIPFECLVEFSENDDELFDMRFESEKQTVVIRGKKAWSYFKDSNTVKVYEDVTTSAGMMRDLKFWYKIAQLNPWIAGKVLATLKLFSDSWEETYIRDELSGRERVIVNCSYKPLESCFWFVFDVESKLIVEAKYWRNTGFEGLPVFYATSIQYDEELDDELFTFDIPPDSEVILRNAELENMGRKETADVIFESGEELFQIKKFDDAIEVYWQVYESYSDLNIAETALMMIGICYHKQGRYDEAIETFEKSIREYGDLKGWIETTYFYLGLTYIETGEDEKALHAFQNCILTGQFVREPDKFPLKQARKYIEKLEARE